jgi:hypothetical protein
MLAQTTGATWGRLTRYGCMVLQRLSPPMLCLLTTLLVFGGCQSPYRSDQGALLGGVLGAGTGAAIGSATGNTLAGAAIGTGVGAISGAAIGGALDEQDAQNRAMIAQQMGRQVPANPVTINDVINMTRAGVDEELIANHVRTHGVVAPLQSQDLITLQQQNVSKRVIAVMQEPPIQQAQPMMVQPAMAQPVYVEPYPYGPPYWGPPCYYYHPYRPRPGMRVGMTFAN